MSRVDRIFFSVPEPAFVAAAFLVVTAGTASAQAARFFDELPPQAAVDFELAPPAWQPPEAPQPIEGLDPRYAPPALVWPAGLPSEPQDVPAAGAPADYSSTIAVGAMLATGNTERRTVNSSADWQRRSFRHRTKLLATFDYAQEKVPPSDDYNISQRYTTGSAKHDYFFTEKFFGFVAVDATYDYAQNIALRGTAMAGFGYQVIEEENLKFSVEAGAGYYLEQSRISGVPDTDYAAGRLSWDLDWTFKPGWQLKNILKYYPSLEDRDEFTGQMDTRLRYTMGKATFAQVQWIADFDNTPAVNALGEANDRWDHRVLLSIGWKL